MQRDGAGARGGRVGGNSHLVVDVDLIGVAGEGAIEVGERGEHGLRDAIREERVLVRGREAADTGVDGLEAVGNVGW